MEQHQEVMARLAAFLDRELKDDEVRQVQAHLESCPACRPCFEFHAALKRLVKKACACDEAPERLRDWVRTLH